jgi:hypothetical protein
MYVCMHRYQDKTPNKYADPPREKKEKVLVPPKDMIYHCKCNRGMFDIHVRIDIRTTKIKNNM